MHRQYDYRHYSMTFRITEEAYEALKQAATRLGTVEIHREPVDDSDEPTVTVDGEERDHYATDHLYRTDGGDVFRRREYHGSGRLEEEDSFDILGSTTAPDRLLPGIYEAEWERQEQDENQYYWFEWLVGTDDEFPQEFTSELPRHIPRSADPEEIED